MYQLSHRLTVAHILRVFLLMAVMACSGIGCQDNTADDIGSIFLEFEVAIPAGLNTFDTHYFIVRNINPNALASNPSITREDINSITPRSAELQTVFEAIDWRIVREAVILISDPQSGNSTTFEIFNQNDRSFIQQERLLMLPTNAQITELMLGDNIEVQLGLSFINITPRNFNTRVTMNFDINGIQ